MAAAAAVTGTLTDVRSLELTAIPAVEGGVVMTELYSQTEPSAGPVIREVVAGEAKIQEVDADAGNLRSLPLALAC
jgi:hypothetical protein